MALSCSNIEFPFSKFASLGFLRYFRNAQILHSSGSVVVGCYLFQSMGNLVIWQLWGLFLAVGQSSNMIAC